MGLSHLVLAFSAPGGLPLASAAGLLSLLMLPFAHEDVAIVFGAYAIVNQVLPTGLVVICIFVGMAASDIALFGVGAGARRLPWLKRFAVDDRVRRFAHSLRRNLFSVFALCRVVPGAAFVAFVACGWAGVPLSRFTLASLSSSALYLPITLYLAVVFGDALDDHVGLWSWPVVLAAMLATAFVRRRVFALGAVETGGVIDANADHDPTAESGTRAHTGMSLLGRRGRRVGLAERIPPLLFSWPLVITWIGLALRHRSLTLATAANPLLPAGGMWGVPRSRCLAAVGGEERRWVADFIVVTRGYGVRTLPADCVRARQAMAEAGIAFPVVAKPDIGRNAQGVCRLDSAAALGSYLARFPAQASVVLQRHVPFAGEATVLYAREPGAPCGRIDAMAFRYVPHVIGDGRSTVLQLMRADARTRWKLRLHLGEDRSHRGTSYRQLDRVPDAGEVVRLAFVSNQRVGGLHRDARRYITPALQNRFDAIARSMPELHYARFDIRFESTDALMCGESFAIVDINGIGGGAVDIWDSRLPLREVYRRLMARQRLVFEIGAANRTRGFRGAGPVSFLEHLFRQAQLIRRYPASS